ncbi:CRISPR-associated protein [Thermobacillus composti KWC4]|uniref:CRISPR-associated protein n=2 Tax=Thermobacillus TaxID=76632 RepID=L0EFX1_THECK|nr:CRISPR-associated protein [Thermobacillus composti KWC4]
MRNDRSGTGTGLAHAPYNFVPFSEKRKVRYEKFEDLPKHDEACTKENGLLSGELTFRIVAQTPILVAQGNADETNRNREFNRDAYSRFEIPGSTLRGLIRSAVGIIGHSDLREGVDNQEQTLMYRGLSDAVTRGLRNRKKEYDRIINKETVKAGYIRMTGKDSYEIIPAEKINEKTFTFVREQQLYKEGVLPAPDVRSMYTKDLLEIEKIGRPKPPKKLVGPTRSRRTEYIEDKRAFLIRYKERLDAYHARLSLYSVQPRVQELEQLVQEYNDIYGMYYSYLRACQSRHYAPYITRKTVYITGNGEYSFQPGRGTRYECALMSSGFMQKKQSHYLIHPADTRAKPIPLRLEEVHWYRYDLIVKGNRLKFKEFYKLPERKGELKPCFYVAGGDFTFFGFTPSLRVFYRNNIKAGLPDYSEGGFDYVQAMFGFAGSKERSYAGRLSFRSAVIEGEPGAIRQEVVIPGQPSLTAVAMYIKQDNHGDLKTLNDKYEWRGIKQYWLKRDFEQPEKNLKSAQKDNSDVKSILHLLPKGTVFNASIRFERLHKDELGLLLAALTWPKHQTIGMGKPYGAGCVTFEDIRLYLDNVMYRLDQFFQDKPKEIPREQFDEFIDSFCDQMKSVCEDVKQSEPVRVYLAMREKVYDHIDKRYMPLSDRDGYPAYQSLLPLPTVGQLLWNEPTTVREDADRQQQNHWPIKKQQSGWKENPNKPYKQ